MWILTGGIAFIIAAVNFILVLKGKHSYCGILVFISLSSGLFAMLSYYGLVNEWVQARDMSALTDVVPTMNTVLTIAVCIGILLNAAAELVTFIRVKKQDAQSPIVK